MTANPFAPAVKRALRARVAFAGPTGGGKTFTALEWAQVLGKSIAYVDTERGSARLYADRFSFDVVELHPPFHPERVVELLKSVEANGYEVCVIDSLSHIWEGEGGVLDIVEAAGERSKGNNFAGWKVGTPALRHLVDTMLGLDAHLVATMRSKMEYVLQPGQNGKQQVVKMGMAPVMRNGVEYEFTILGDLDLEHRITISKSRCPQLADVIVQPHRAAEAAETFKAWLNDGEQLIDRAEQALITAAFTSIEDDDQRRQAKQDFVAVFGPLAQIGESAIEDAWRAIEQVTGLNRAGVLALTEGD